MTPEQQTHYAETPSGFEFGAAVVTRQTTLPNGSVVLCIESKRAIIHIRVTKSGLIKPSMVGEIERMKPRKSAKAKGGAQ